MFIADVSEFFASFRKTKNVAPIGRAGRGCMSVSNTRPSIAAVLCNEMEHLGLASIHVESRSNVR